MITVIESKTTHETIRLAKAANETFVVERWESKHETWEHVYYNPDFWIALHVYLDELCKMANLASSTKNDTATEKKTRKRGAK